MIIKENEDVQLRNFLANFAKKARQRTFLDFLRDEKSRERMCVINVL